MGGIMAAIVLLGVAIFFAVVLLSALNLGGVAAAVVGVMLLLAAIGALVG